MMKKVILILCLAFGFSQISNAQVAFGLKGGLNYNSNSIKEVKTDVFDGAKSKTGYHAGIWLRFKIPVIGLYLRPELVYTNLENEVTYDNSVAAAKTTTYNFQKIDIPVLLGKKIFGIGNIYVGPSFQYILDSDFGFDDIKDVETSGFTAGLQFGGGIELGKLGIDVRWERAFSGVESTFIGTAGDVNFDTRVNQIIVGLSYRL
ncbi:porin family protein [Polaribacter sp. Hel1_85]|uniref:porin family protein n=1 Tax=Polaribacter sp. Hel1_85 TaxID=1250005 RepID=UPI001F393E8D|nr:porin family protein [Polaribacter sp. Hel1_85]